MASPQQPECFFCHNDGGTVVWRDDALRVILPTEPDYPGFVRAVWREHVPEMSDLTGADRGHLMRAVFATEQTLRDLLMPDKINIASLGNMVPHVHWHVIPRFRDDPHFPNPVWGQKLRSVTRAVPPDFESRLAAQLRAVLG